MKDYVAFILTLIFLALIFIGYSLYKNSDISSQPSVTDDILGNLTPTNLNEAIENPLSKNDLDAQKNNDVLSSDNIEQTFDRENPLRDSNTQTGNLVAGRLCFPSEEPLPLDIYLQDVKNPKQFKKVSTTKEEMVYKFTNIPAGKYTVFAYVKGNNRLSGGYTKAVPCGLTLNCDDHKLIEIDVGSSQLITYADICDWFGGKIPARPD